MSKDKRLVVVANETSIDICYTTAEGVRLVEWLIEKGYIYDVTFEINDYDVSNVEDLTSVE